MTTQPRTGLEQRVVEAAEDALADQHYVSTIEVFLRLGWLAPSHVRQWQQGRMPDLETVLNVGAPKVSRALRLLQGWAQENGLKATTADYVARTRDRRPLRFSASGDPEVEQVWRTHWISAELSERRQQQVAAKASKPPDLVVISPLKDWTCAGCDGSGGLLMMDEAGPLCLTCVDLDHLEYLPSGDAALTRRARKESGLSAVVVRFSRARKRYERQGVLVEAAALEAAEQHCLEDAEARMRRRERDAQRRALADADHVERLATAIRTRYPGCPADRARQIAEHTAVRGSGRIGRTAAALDLHPTVIDLAVTASVRHRDTPYDELLMTGTPREEARYRVRDEVAAVLETWRTAPTQR